jgi:hypothetical protein
MLGHQINVTAHKPKIKIFTTETKFTGLCENIRIVRGILYNKSVKQASGFTYLIYLISNDRRNKEINLQSQNKINYLQ